MPKDPEPLDLICGARPLAEFIFRDGKKFKAIYSADLQKLLGLFELAGKICGRPGTIHTRIAQLEGNQPDAA